jgi:hypothetical protein
MSRFSSRSRPRPIVRAKRASRLVRCSDRASGRPPASVVRRGERQRSRTGGGPPWHRPVQVRRRRRGAAPCRASSGWTRPLTPPQPFRVQPVRADAPRPRPATVRTRPSTSSGGIVASWRGGRRVAQTTMWPKGRGLGHSLGAGVMPNGRSVRVRGGIGAGLIAALLAAGCGHSPPPGVVDGSFSVPGEPAADLQRGGLNFAKTSEGVHGNGAGHTVRVSSDGAYTVTLSPGSYSVIGGLSGQPGGPAAGKCAEAMTVVVTAKSTTRADYVCHLVPVTSAAP